MLIRLRPFYRRSQRFWYLRIPRENGHQFHGMVTTDSMNRIEGHP